MPPATIPGRSRRPAEAARSPQSRGAGDSAGPAHASPSARRGHVPAQPSPAPSAHRWGWRTRWRRSRRKAPRTWPTGCGWNPAGAGPPRTAAWGRLWEPWWSRSRGTGAEPSAERGRSRGRRLGSTVSANDQSALRAEAGPGLEQTSAGLARLAPLCRFLRRDWAGRPDFRIPSRPRDSSLSKRKPGLVV